MKAVASKKPSFPAYEHYEAELHALLNIMQALRPDWSCGDWAAASGLHRSTVFAMFRGDTRFPRLDSIWKLADAAGLRINLTAGRVGISLKKGDR